AINSRTLLTLISHLKHSSKQQWSHKISQEGSREVPKTRSEAKNQEKKPCEVVSRRTSTKNPIRPILSSSEFIASLFPSRSVYAATGNYNVGGCASSNTIPNHREDIKVITKWSGITLAGPSVPSPNSSSSSKEVERDPKMTMDQVHISSSESTARVPSPVIQPALASKSNEIPEQNPHQPSIPYPSRLNKDKLQDKSDIQIYKFLQMFKKLHFNISFAKALTQMPK
ncbi:hypothetical protein Tco_1561711, partial [Tanacetum coccineum]